MELYNENKVTFNELVIDGIKFILNPTRSIQIDSMEYLRYISSDNNDEYSFCDYVIAYINDEYVGAFIGESISSFDVKEYASKDDLLYSIRILCAKDNKVLETLLNYIKN